MKTLHLKSLTALCVAAVLAPQIAPPNAMAQDHPLYAEITQPKVMFTTAPEASPTISVARLDGGRYVPTPFSEIQDWDFLSARTGTNFEQLGASQYIRYVPETPQGIGGTDNKIDEIRLTAANEGYAYVLIYGVGPDAGWASFGRKVLSETGLKIQGDCASWEAAKAKALLVESRSGQVIGAVTTNNIEYNIGELADRVGQLITTLDVAPEQQI